MECGRRIELEGSLNTRDLGGYPTMDKRHVKSGKLIRSGALAKLTDRDIEVLKDKYNLKTDIDFRTDMEVKQKPDPVIEGVRYIRNPILGESAMGVTMENMGSLEEVIVKATEFFTSQGGNVADYMGATYKQLAGNEYSVSQYKKFFDILIEQKEGAVLWHCSAGKDRVGVGTALVLSALNVSRDVIMKDYLLTNTFLQKETDGLVAEVAKFSSSTEVQEAAAILNRVEESYLLMVFQSIDKNYGSMEAFLEQRMALTKEKRELLKEKYTI